jgi:hypothetical protein
VTAPDPIAAPYTRDSFTLDGNIRSPGLAILRSGGNQHEDIQDMGQPLTRGKNTLVRATDNIVAEYEIRLWLPEHFTAWDTFEAMLFEGKSRTPNPRTYTFIDPRVPRLTMVIVEDIGPEMIVARGGPWYHTVKFHQWQRIRMYGGPAQAPKNPVEQAIESLSAQNRALDQQLAAAQAAAKQGK